MKKVTLHRITNGKSAEPDGDSDGNQTAKLSFFNEKIQNTDYSVAKQFVPREPKIRNRINDIQVKITKKTKIQFLEEDMKYPSIAEAISGKFRVRPIFKQVGEVFLEITEYPPTILEPISYGAEHKEYRYIIKQTNEQPLWADTRYGDPINLDQAAIQGYSHGKLYNIGEFCYWAMVEKENEYFDKEMSQELKIIKKNTVEKLQMNEEYEIRIQILRAQELTMKGDSPPDPQLNLYTEQWSYNGRAEQKEANQNPKFQKMFRLRTKIPETNTLSIEIWDYDLFCDELIGKTTISLTERILFPNQMKMHIKPVEDKPLQDDSSPFQRGRLKYILEVFPCYERPKEIEKYSEITTKIVSKVGSKNGSRRMSRQGSHNSLEGSRMQSRNGHDLSKGNQSNGHLSGRLSNGTPRSQVDISVLSHGSGIPKNLNESYGSSKQSQGTILKDKKMQMPAIQIEGIKNGVNEQFSTAKKQSTQKEELTLRSQNSSQKAPTKRSIINKPDGEKEEINILSDAEMLKKQPLINITSIPPRRFEIRMVIWNAEDVESTDTSGSVDAYIKTWCSYQQVEKKTTMPELNTDTHWFCNNQCPNWNFRIVWDSYWIDDAGPETHHKMTFQLWDKNIIGSDELIGENVIDFTELAKFCYEENIRQSAIGELKEDGCPIFSRIEWSSDKGSNLIEIVMQGKNKLNQLESRGKLFVSFNMIPFELAEMSKVGQGRSDPNLDPYLPEPAGRFSLSGSIFGGFFVVAGKLFSFLLNIVIIVAVIALSVQVGQSFASSFGGALIAQLLTR